MMSRTPGLFILVGLSLVIRVALAADADVQRQLQLRDQQQTELRLKMQQQMDRSQRAPASDLSPSAARRQVLERDQQQRLQMLHDQQLRSGIASPETTPAPRDIERQRSLNASGAELQRFEVERRSGAGVQGPGPMSPRQ